MSVITCLRYFPMFVFMIQAITTVGVHFNVFLFLIFCLFFICVLYQKECHRDLPLATPTKVQFPLTLEDSDQTSITSSKAQRALLQRGQRGKDREGESWSHLQQFFSKRKHFLQEAPGGSWALERNQKVRSPENRKLEDSCRLEPNSINISKQLLGMGTRINQTVSCLQAARTFMDAAFLSYLGWDGLSSDAAVCELSLILVSNPFHTLLVTPTKKTNRLNQSSKI